jgi:hypothetical protein
MVDNVRVSSKFGGLQCALCAELIGQGDGLVRISLASRTHGQQGFFAHAACFKRAMHPSMASDLCLDDVPPQSEK